MEQRDRSARMPTIADVAREAGVNKISVSVVLNGSRSSTRVSQATRERILEAAARLQYQPNAAARSLALGRSNVIGVLFGALPVAPSPLREVYGASIIQGIADACGVRDFDLMMFTKPWFSTPDLSIARLKNKQTDGIIVIAPHSDSGIVESLAEAGLRIVAVSYPSPEVDDERKSASWVSVDVDNYRGARLAVEHLIHLGHRRIGHLMGTPTVASAIARWEGYRDALRAAGIPEMPELVVQGKNMGTPGCEDGSFSGENSAADTCRLLALAHPPTAVFAANDMMAIEVLQGARMAGARVPEDLSIVGFDDRHIVSLLEPPLTTIRQPMVTVGETAANLLIDHIERETLGSSPGDNEAGTVNVLIPPELIVRRSTGPVKS